jgi:hypothetical protein
MSVLCCLVFTFGVSFMLGADVFIVSKTLSKWLQFCIALKVPFAFVPDVIGGQVDYLSKCKSQVCLKCVLQNVTIRVENFRSEANWQTTR